MAGAIVLALVVAVAVGIWFWGVLVAYINPGAEGATDRKDAVQVYAVIVAGVVASITAAVGLANLRISRRNLEQQRELEGQRAQGGALQSYYEQMGKLLTEHDLRTTDREEIHLLARGQTLTMLRELDASRKGSLLTFLYGAGLIDPKKTAVTLHDADLSGADLSGAEFMHANLNMANLNGANLNSAHGKFAHLGGANLNGTVMTNAYLFGIDLSGANLGRADLSNATLQGANLRDAKLGGALHDRVPGR